MSDLLAQRSGAVVTLTIHRPAALNALTGALLADLRRAVEEAADDRTVRAVVITGSGEKAFSAGADLNEISVLGSDLDKAREVMAAGQAALRAIERAPVPVIAAVNGLALGGGFELVLASTFAVLSTRASLGLPEAALGLIPGYGGTQRLPRAVGHRVAAHLMLTGARLSADRAYELGVTPVPPVAPEELLPTATSIAETIAARGPLAVRAILHAAEAARDAPLEEGLTTETELAARAIASPESTEGVAAFTERRPPVFPNPED
ncbi:enoyl-CoA hydratase/isomerase family protein [Amycolatopsis granulosa]|uniref:enoyl-CoA hydratase/isomerase family protein n=1 Tax=Amycolatopsis granulosa TaxID=185684 RepID=UPI0014245878|nr:enoyl-CoA hydratase/isomerase family protein [Amycolatopsis granulosa]NIH83349.1 enoyl-CoA hydratase [Amycolatopsis granulosa]